MNKKIFYAFISLILMSLINCKTYAQNTGSASIDGYAVEVYNDNIIDEEDDETSPIQDILVELLDSNDNTVASTRTDENGKYTFNNVRNGTYKIQYSWGKVDENELNNATSENGVKKIQNILKYNGQDYYIYDENQSSILENDELREDINYYFKSFSYDNTIIFTALNMQVSSDSDLKNFKQYALDLSNSTYMTGKSTQAFTIDNSSNQIEGPVLKLMQRDPYTISPSVSLLEMSITLNNGSVIDSMSTDASNPGDLVSSLDEKNTYGSNLKLKYNISFDNVSNYSSCSRLAFLLYLPNKFDYNESYGIKATGISGNNEITDLAIDNITTFNSDNIDDLDDVSDDVINYLAKNSAIYVSIDLTKQDFSLSQGESINVTLSVSSLLSKQDNLLYNGKVEIIEYENDYSRCLQYFGTDKSTTDAIAGNFNKNESDYIESNNWASIIPPTGKNKNYLMLILIFCLLGIVFLAYFRPISYLITKIRKKI